MPLPSCTSLDRSRTEGADIPEDLDDQSQGELILTIYTQLIKHMRIWNHVLFSCVMISTNVNKYIEDVCVYTRKYVRINSSLVWWKTFVQNFAFAVLLFSYTHRRVIVTALIVTGWKTEELTPSLFFPYQHITIRKFLPLGGVQW